MKILAIRGRNLASLEGDFAVELDQGPLGRAGLFLIHGPVGAGKSTVLDAMCLALFDRVPRLANAGKGHLADVDPELTVADPRNVLRRGSSDGMAEVDFVGRDGRRWRATWHARRARGRPDGKLQASTLALQELGGPGRVGDLKGEVLRAIEAQLGLGWDQFCRSALLAQGEFAAFLRSKADERAGLLERMTGTDVYGRISIAAHERLGREQGSLAAIESQIATEGGLGDQARAAVEQRLAEAIVAREAAVAADARAKAAVASAEAAAGRRAQVRMAEAALEAATRAHAATEALSVQIAMVSAARDVLPFVLAEQAASEALRRAVAARDLATAHLAAATAELGAADIALVASEAELRVAVEGDAEAQPILEAAARLDAEFAAIQARAQAVEASVAAAEAELRPWTERARGFEASVNRATRVQVDARRWLDQNAAIAALLADRGSLLASIDAVVGLGRALAELRSAAEQAERALVAGDVAWQAATEAVSVAERGLDETNAAQRDLLIEANAVGSARDLRARVRTAVESDAQRVVALDAVGSALQAHMQRFERRHELLDEAAAQVELTRRRSAEADRLGREQLVAAARAEEADLHRERLVARQELASRRHQLVDGEPCPLCGATEHPFSAGVADPDVVDATRRVAELRALAIELHGRREAALAEARTASAREESARIEAQALSGLVEVAARDYEAAREAYADLEAAADEIADDPRAEGVADVIRDLRGAAADRRDRAAALERRLGEGIEAVEQASSALDRARAEQWATESRRVALRADRDRAAGECDRAAARREEHLAVLADRLVGLSRWRDELENDPEAFRRSLVGRIEATAEQQQRLAAASAEIDRSAAELELARIAESKAAEALAARRDALVASTAALEALGRERNALFHGRSVADVRAALATQRDRSASMCATARERRLRAELGEIAARAAADGAASAADLASSTHTAAVDELGRRLADTGVAPEGLLRDCAALAATSAAQIAAWRASVDAAARAVADARSALDTRRADAAADPPPVDIDPLFAAAEAAEAARGAAEDRRAELQAELRADNDRKARRADLHAERVRRQASVDRWKALHGLVGSSDGQKFRKFAQGLTLDALIAHANETLTDLAPRYRLQRVPGSDLDLQVVDRDTADLVRSVNSLSGGETFLVSLALALGLSGLAAHDVRVQSLFIDEGFGTLDPDTLDAALDALDALQSTGRQVGVISHVPGLAERFLARVKVVPKGAGRSVIEIE